MNLKLTLLNSTMLKGKRACVAVSFVDHMYHNSANDEQCALPPKNDWQGFSGELINVHQFRR